MLADRDRAGRRVVGEPFHARERPFEEELRRQRRDREIEALDAQRRQAEQDADQHRHHAAEQEHQDDVGLRQPQREIVGGIGADRHEPAGAERHLAAIAGQDVESDRREREDQHRDQHLGVEVLAGEQRDAPETRKQPAAMTNQRSCAIGKIAWSAA